MNKASAEIARTLADEFTAANPKKPRYVAGAVGPTNKTLSLSPDVNNPGYRAVTFDEVKAAYREHIEGLLDGGAEFLLVETIFDTLNAKAALVAIEDPGIKRPGIAGHDFGNHHRCQWAHPLRTDSGGFLHSLAHVKMLSIGLNCSLGAAELKPYLRELSQKAPFLHQRPPQCRIAQPVRGVRRDPETMGVQIRDYLDHRYVNIVGGCCGTTPEHIRAIADA